MRFHYVINILLYRTSKRLSSTRKFLPHRPRWSSQYSHIMKSCSSSDDIPMFILDKIGFSPNETMEVKRVYLKTEHGYTFNINKLSIEISCHLFLKKQYRT